METTVASSEAAHRMVELGAEECRRLLGTTGVGRIAVTVRALPAIFPVNYAVLDGDIVFRTGPGSKLDAASCGEVVAFEVDEADRVSHNGWSVLVVGIARVVDTADEVDRARKLPLAPWVGGAEDRFVRLDTEVISGRRIVHGVQS